MSVEKIWVHAEGQGSEVATITLELLAKARELGNTVEAFLFWRFAADMAQGLGEHGVTTLYSVGRFGRRPAGTSSCQRCGGGDFFGQCP